MPNVEKWLYENDFNFIKKPGVGLIIDESLENKEFILELLEFENIKKEYTKEERKRIKIKCLFCIQNLMYKDTDGNCQAKE